MSSIVLSGDTSGTVTVAVPAVAGTNTVTIPAATGTVALTSDVIGVGQTWQNVGSSRALGTTYTNSTGKPIQLSVTINHPAGANSEISISVNSVVIGGLADTYGGNSPALKMALQHIIPAGATYAISIVLGSPTIASWFELR